MPIRDAYVVFRVSSRSRDELHARAENYVRENWGVELHDAPKTAEPLPAYVNYGRWVADCPCGSGVVCSPSDEDAICLECGTVHRIAFPHGNSIRAAEGLLEARPTNRRHWFPDVEKVADLKAENDAFLGGES